MLASGGRRLGASSEPTDRQNGDEEATGDEIVLPLFVQRNMVGTIQAGEGRPESAYDGHGSAEFADDQCRQHAEHTGG